ncbi:MAG TPA: hypothetical protein VHE30_04410 [Polyangiaceae bacterium]|nr:hypothetical protein [Polyangiaceae bacterium]
MEPIVFSTALLTLAVEVLYTRLFSALFWKNAAFAILSLAMLGIGASGVLVYLAPRWFSAARRERQLCVLTALFGLSIAVSYLWILSLSKGSFAVVDMLGTYAPLALAGLLPYFFGGLVLSVVFTHSAGDLARLYRIDLGGAALGAVLVLPALRIANGPLLVPLLGLVATLVALAYARRRAQRGAAIFAAVASLALGALVVLQVRTNVLGITHSHGQEEKNVELERWDPIARIMVETSGEDTKWINIDSQVQTAVLRWDGHPESVSYLKQNVLQLAYRLRKYQKVLVIGPGGGSDVLSAVTSGSPDVTGVEVNRTTIRLMKNELRDYTGGLYLRPGVKLEVADGRAYVAAMKGKVDLLQATFVDTFASAASGAHTVSENYLYTVEGFGDFLDHLNPEGVLSLSRWGGETFTFAEIHRTVAMMIRTLSVRGVVRPDAHVVVVQGAPADKLTLGGGYQHAGNVADAMTTILVKNTPFSQAELDVLEGAIRAANFQPLWLGSRGGPDRTIRRIFAAGNSPEFFRRYRSETGLDITPVTDDRPFFFDMIDPIHSLFFAPKPEWLRNAYYWARTLDITMLHQVFYTTLVLSFLLLLLPMVGRWRDLRTLERPIATLGYFVCLGVGFIGIELTLMQRFSLFLEHPVYSLVVFLASILLFSGWGSASTAEVERDWATAAPKRALALVAVLVLYGGLVPPVTRALIGLSLPLKMLIAVGFAYPPAFLMGTMFPLGIAAIRGRAPGLVPWVWGLNSAFSVVGAVSSLFLAMSLGFTATWFLFSGAYALAAVAMLRLRGAAAA